VSVAETALRRRGRLFDLRNLGFSGGTIADYVRLGPSIMSRYHPAVLVIQLSSADFGPETFDPSHVNHFARETDGSLRLAHLDMRVGPPSLGARLKHASALVNYSQLRYLRIAERRGHPRARNAGEIPPRLAAKVLLLCVSCIFYAHWDWRFLGLLATVTILDYYVAQVLQLFSRESQRHAFALRAPCRSTVDHPINRDLILHVRDTQLCHRRLPSCDTSARSILVYAILITFFSRLVAEPIMRGQRFLPQLEHGIALTSDNFARGAQNLWAGDSLRRWSWPAVWPCSSTKCTPLRGILVGDRMARRLRLLRADPL
jgi:hypothetical protein